MSIEKTGNLLQLVVIKATYQVMIAYQTKICQVNKPMKSCIALSQLQTDSLASSFQF